MSRFVELPLAFSSKKIYVNPDQVWQVASDESELTGGVSSIAIVGADYPIDIGLDLLELLARLRGDDGTRR